MKHVLYMDTSHIERFSIELNDPISLGCHWHGGISRPNYPFQPVCSTSLQPLIIPTATSQSAQCYISKIEPLICPQQHRHSKNRARNEKKYERQNMGESETESETKKREQSGPDVVLDMVYWTYWQCHHPVFRWEQNSEARQGFVASQKIIRDVWVWPLKCENPP